MQKSRNAKFWVVQKFPEVSLPRFCFTCIQVPIDLMALLQNAKRLGFHDSTTSLVAFLYLSLCSNASTQIQKEVFCSNVYKQALIIENEKSESSWASKAYGHKKLCRHAQTQDQIHLTLSFSPKLSLAPCSTPLYFFALNFKFYPLF